MKKAANKTPQKTRASKKVKKQTYVAIVVDRSGSMHSVAAAAVSGMNEQIQALRSNADSGGDTRVTLIQFNDKVETLYENLPAKDLKDVLPSQYSPNGTTAMRDAVWAAITTLKGSVKRVTKDTGFLVVVISDGHENASRECTAEMLLNETKALEATGKWTFTYLLSNQDIKLAEQTLGVLRGNIASYDSSRIGTSQGFSNMARSTAVYMSSRSAGQTATAAFYAGDANVTTAPDAGTINTNPVVVPPPIKQDATVVIKTGVSLNAQTPKLPGQ